MSVSSELAIASRNLSRSSPTVQDGAPYYIYASSAGKDPDQNVQVLSPGSATDDFVDSLNEEHVLVLSAKPSPVANLDASDETRKWFQQLDSAATGSIKVQVDDSAQEEPPLEIESFEFGFSQPWQMTFSSASDVLLFTFGASPLVGEGSGSRIPSPGISDAGDTLTCGLDFVQTKEIVDATLRDLVTYAIAGDTADGIPGDMLDLAVTLKRPAPSDLPRRNALWFVPASDKRINIRLQFQMPDFEMLQRLLSAGLKGLTVTSTDVICSKELATAEKGDQPLHQGGIAFSIECSVKADTPDAPVASMVAGVVFSPSAIDISFIFLYDNPVTDKPLAAILKWLAGLAEDDTLEPVVNDILYKEENGTRVLSEFRLRQMTMTLNNQKDVKAPKLSSFAIDIEASANIGTGFESEDNPAVFLLSYNWDESTGGSGNLAGRLWNDFDPSGDLDLQPNQEKWTTLQPLTSSPAATIDIAKLIPSQTVVNIPDTLPSQIPQASVVLSQSSFAIQCIVVANPVSPGSVPQPALGQVVLDASFAWGKSSSFTLDVAIDASIEPSQPSEGSGPEQPALLTGSLSYDSATGSWNLKGSITGLYASTLVEFFAEDAKPHVGPLIESIVIDTLGVEYKYEPVGDGVDKGKSRGSEFAIQGNLLIDILTLLLDFRYDKDGFTFSATLNTQNKEAKVGDVLSAALGTDIELPSFVYNTEFAGTDREAFQLVVEKQTTLIDDAENTSFQFLAQLIMGQLHLDFAQLHNAEWPATARSKRLARASIDGFSKIEIDVPLIGTLPQPLDELCFLWVQDPPPKGGGIAVGNSAGLTRLDVDQLNSSLSDKILVEDKIKPEQQKPTDLLVSAGCHFSVIIRSTTGERSCLMDYSFMKPTVSNAQSYLAITSEDAGSRKTLKDVEADDGGPSAQAPYKKTAGPLLISNVGLKYKNRKLMFLFDATFELGPIGFSLLGFGLEAEFTTLDKVPNLTPHIEGLSPSFDKPPLSIEGIIRHVNDGGQDYFAGGLIVGWQPYQFQAAGFYGTVIPKGGAGEFRTIFVFAKLNGPLVTLEFAEITSICGGFGYNSTVRVPTVDDIYQFPFVASQGLSGSDNALEALQELVDPGPSGWFQPLDKMYWAAVGMKVGAFQMLSVDAVVVVQFGDAIKLGIFAVALADIPSADSPVKFAHVELGILAVVDFDYGTLMIETQLSPRSYILSPDCHLTGGAALYYWFDAPHADKSSNGQFVFTLGGYHQAYRVPVGYPNPPRLEISWSPGGGLKISGQAYFAITPKACMAGGRLHASYKAGPIEAWFDAFADFLINYKPFYFNMQAGLSVGVGFSIDVWFIHIRISVEIGAELYLWGPPLAGRVHVDLWIASFDINFGDSRQQQDTVNLAQFYRLVLQSSTASMASAGKAMLAMEEEATEAVSSEKNQGHNFLAQSGLMNPTDKPERDQNEPWIVRAGSFCFVVECKMAINIVKAEADGDAIIKHGDPDKGVDVFSKPMKLQSPMTSTITIQVKQDDASDPDEGWQYDKYLKNVPRGLWAKYDARTDPRTSGNNIGDLLNGDDSAMALMMGVQITAPKPTLSPDPFPAFKVADADLQRLLAERPFTAMADADSSWAPATAFTGADVKKQYDSVVDSWVNPALGTGDDGQSGFVGVLAESFTWDDVSGLKSIAKIPERLRKGFMNMYMAAPLLTV